MILLSGFLGNTGLSRAWLSWTVVDVLVLVGLLSLFSKYASRAALILVLLGNGILTFCWYYNGAYHNATEDRTGSIHWVNEWPTKVISFPPTYDQNGAIYLLRPNDYTGPMGLSLVALGKQWRGEIRPSGGICTLPAIADDGTILFGTGTSDSAFSGLYAGQGPVWAVSPEGTKKWTYEFPPATFFRSRGGGSVFPTKSPACSQPAVAPDGSTYWVGHGVYALTSDGALRWAFEPGEDFFYSLAIAEDGSLYALADGALYTLAPDGSQRWKYSFEESKYFAGEVAVGTDGTVYFTNRNPGLSSQLFALTPQGILKWRNESYDLRGGPLIGSDGTVYITVSVLIQGDGNEKEVMALDPKGEAKWNTPEGSYLLDLGSDGTIYICYIRDLFAISPRGTMLWKAKLPDDPAIHIPTDAVTLAPNGKFYIGDFTGRLGTLDAPGLATSGWPARFHDPRNTARAGAH